MEFVIQKGKLISYDESIVDVVIPEDVKSLDKNVFKNKPIQSIAFNQTIKSVTVGAFLGCKALKQVNLSDSITKLFGACFKEYTSLTSIYILNFYTNILTYFWTTQKRG